MKVSVTGISTSSFVMRRAAFSLLFSPGIRSRFAIPHRGNRLPHPSLYKLPSQTHTDAI